MSFKNFAKAILLICCCSNLAFAHAQYNGGRGPINPGPFSNGGPINPGPFADGPIDIGPFDGPINIGPFDSDEGRGTEAGNTPS